MKYENKKILVICVLMVAFLGFLSYRNIRDFEIPEGNLIPPGMPELTIPSLQDLFSGNIGNEFFPENDIKIPYNFEYKSYTIDNRIIFEYPSYWTKLDINEEKVFAGIYPLFMAYSGDIDSPTILTVARISALDINSVIKKIKGVFLGENIIMEITKEEENENGRLINVIYTYEDGRKGLAKEQIVASRDNFYIISVITFGDQTEDQLSKMEKIIQSIQIIK